MLEWKQKLGVRATYRKLVDVFERAGYKHYADHVKRIAADDSDSDSDTDDSSCSDGDYPFPQPLSYLPQESHTQSSFQVASKSQYESHYVLINPSKAESVELLKEGIIHYHLIV